MGCRSLLVEARDQDSPTTNVALVSNQWTFTDGIPRPDSTNDRTQGPRLPRASSTARLFYSSTVSPDGRCSWLACPIPFSLVERTSASSPRSQRRYTQRWQVETVVSMIRRNLRDALSATIYQSQFRELRRLVTVHNIMIL